MNSPISDRPEVSPHLFDDLAHSVAWIRGSLLPHTSTWWTIQRFIRLNHPTRAEFCTDVGSMNLLDRHDIFNNSGAFDGVISHSKLAKVLGESEQLLALGCTSALPHPSRRLFLNYPRMCPICAELGYHSILMSLDGINACPVHDCRFVDACECGAKFPTEFADLIVAPGRCSTCDKIFIRNSILFKPKITSSDLGGYLQLGGWVTAMCQWLFSPPTERGSLSALRDNWLAAQWQRHPKVTPYELLESLFSTPEKLENWHGRVTESRSGPLPGYSDKSPAPARSPVLTIYSATSRFIRRHVLSPDFKVLRSRLTALADADRIFQVITSSQAGMLAWRYVLWTMHVELRQGLRAKWNSSKWTCFEAEISACAMDVEPAASKNQALWKARREGKPLGLPHRQWYRLHAAETALLSLWRALANCVEKSIETGDVAWGDGLVDRAELCDWIAMRDMSGTGTRKVAYARFIDIRTPGDPLVPWQRRSKHQRRLMSHVRTLARLATLATTTIRVNEALEVRVASAAIPTGQVHRNNVRVASRWLACQVFRDGETWIARLGRGHVEAVSTSYRQALALMLRYLDMLVSTRGLCPSMVDPPTSPARCPSPAARG